MDARVRARRILFVSLLATSLVVFLTIAVVSLRKADRDTGLVSPFPDEPTTTPAHLSATDVSATGAPESAPLMPGSSAAGSASKGPGGTSGVPRSSGPKVPVGVPSGPVNACGVPPAGKALDGRSLQRIYFPDPGSHQWPDSEMTLRACATSGLPVTYQLENGGRGGDCYVSDPTATTVRAQGIPLSCEITAKQAGNAEFAPAEPATATWTVGKLAVTLGWVGTDDSLVYLPSSPTAAVQLRVTAMHSIPPLQVSTHADGACRVRYAPMSVGRNEEKDITFDLELVLTDPAGQPASCDLRVSVHSNHVVDGSQVNRHYNVTSG